MAAMSPSSWRREGLRLLLVGSTLAFALVPVTVHRRADAPGVGSSSEVAEPAQTPPQAAAGRWSLRAGGWYISVDGAEVEVPSLAQQTKPRIRIRGPQPLSPYDHLIVYHARAQGLDWRLVAALIYEESRFVPDAVSDRGAYGLMQVRPIAAAAVGSEHFKAPADNIRTGARYLKQLSETFSEAHGRDHLALVLAAYNMGPGHVRDAQQLARRFGYDPNVWHESLALVFPLLEQMPFCARPELLPNGCAQGKATVAYVDRVLQRYDAYRLRFGVKRGDLDDDGASADAAHAASANG
jgi:soluble lytic murein transglycosylase-like protein